jgi:hypothetical protein
MKRLLLPFLLSAVALLAPGRILAQEKPVLNTAPPGTVPTRRPAAPVDTANVAPTIPVYTPATRPTYTPPVQATPADAQPSPYSPSGLELPGREQARKAAQQHADQYTKLFVYSGIGLGYSSIYGYSNFNFSISPAIGYRVNDRLSIGPGISYAYNYYGVDNSYSGGGRSNTKSSISTSSYGAKVFAQFMVYNNFFIHAEYESTKAQFLAVDQYNQYIGTVTRTVQTPLAGIGYRSQISNRAAADIVVLYNFQDNYNSIYPNPVIRFNFLFNIGR